MIYTPYTKKIFSFVSLLAVVGLFVFCSTSVFGASQLQADWLWDEDIEYVALASQPANVEPWTYGVDCVGTYVVSGVSTCVKRTPVGSIANNTLIDGPKGTHEFSTFYGFIAPSIPERPDTILTFSSPSWMGNAHMVQYSTYKPSNLTYSESSGLPTIKQYRYRPESPVSLTYANGQTAGLVAQSIAFSSNGDHMVVGIRGGGVVVYNTNTMVGKVISVDAKLTGFDRDKKGANLAVSDDGQFVAANVDLGSPALPRPSILVYETRTCFDQSPYLTQRTKSNPCEHHDIWNGTFRSMSFGALSGKMSVEYPRNLRFIGNGGLRFEAVHSRTSSSSFLVTQYMATADLVQRKDYIGLLGMGDSYISGEGAFNYRTPTDTKANKCHNSWLAYPYTKGNQHVVRPVSVACSGAVLEDVDTTNEQYIGQSRVNPQIPWEDRYLTQQNMIERKYLPGYKGQVLFAGDIKPKATLLSIGGNDIHFSDIIKGCVTNVAESSCYSSYRDRKNLMQKAASLHDDLVKAYTETKTVSKGNVYVVGYPEIAKPGGNCGGNVRMDAAEVQFSVDLVTFLNKVIKNAASDAGVLYVDNQKALNGYRLCEAPKGKPGMHGFTVGTDSGFWKFKTLGNESYHPTALGAKLLGDSIVAKTNNFTAPMPAKTKLGAPAITNNDPLLKGLSQGSYNYSEIIWKGGNGQPTAKIQRGKTYTLTMQTSNIKVGSTFSAELHSDPVELYRGTYSPVNDVRVTIPADVAPGLHALHIIGTNSQGVAIDVIEQVYVVASETDYDGDGVPNDQASCVLVLDSGVDEDADGLDDACDTLGAEDFIPEQTIADDPPEDYSVLTANAVDATPADSLLVEYIEHVEPPKVEPAPPKYLLTTQQPALTNDAPGNAPAATTASNASPETTAVLAGALEPNTSQVYGVASMSTGVGVARALKTEQHVATAEGKDQTHIGWYMTATIVVLAFGAYVVARTRRSQA